VPPLAFMLHYAARCITPWAEPVLLGTLLGQALIVGSVLAASMFLADAFGPLAAFPGLTFARVGRSVPSLVRDGYFALNVGIASQPVPALERADGGGRMRRP
jgi:hypothetical protein